MNKPVEDRGIMSRLPEDRPYWEGLTDRIVEEALPTLADRRDQGNEWWSAMSRFSDLLATGALAATIAAIAFLPPVPIDLPATAQEPVEDALGIAPDHPLAVLMAGTPPRMEALVLNATETSDERLETVDEAAGG